MANKVKKSEHNGAKNGGGFWGRRTEAKQMSNKQRRNDTKEIIIQESAESD
ncbi:hypothetical protein AB3N62_00605 [Leptospira sp. WS4.C2]